MPDTVLILLTLGFGAAIVYMGGLARRFARLDHCFQFGVQDCEAAMMDATAHAATRRFWLQSTFVQTLTGRAAMLVKVEGVDAAMLDMKLSEFLFQAVPAGWTVDKVGLVVCPHDAAAPPDSVFPFAGEGKVKGRQVEESPLPMLQLFGTKKVGGHGGSNEKGSEVESSSEGTFGLVCGPWYQNFGHRQRNWRIGLWIYRTFKAALQPPSPTVLPLQCWTHW